MSLGYEFTPIDVSITTHPKAFAAGVEAMGLWLWGMAYAKQHRTDGQVHRAAVLGAWGGKRNVVLAKRLVDAGLWVAREDGDWDIFNFEAKGPGRQTSSTERMRRLRDRKKKEAAEAALAGASGDAGSDVTSVTGDVTVTRHPVTLCSPSVSPSSGSSSGSDPDLPDRSPTPRVWGRGGPAEKALEVFADAITSVTGEPFIVGPAMWLRDDICALLNRRAPKGSLDEALKWLGDTVQDWVRADPDCHDRKPSKLTDWLNASKPDRRRKTGPRAVAVQSMDGACFKIPEGF